jgi:hypothetical protein
MKVLIRVKDRVYRLGFGCGRRRRGSFKKIGGFCDTIVKEYSAIWKARLVP